MRVKVVLHEECLKAGGAKVYPHNRTGELLDVLPEGVSVPAPKERLAYVVFDDYDKMFIPEWLLHRLPDPSTLLAENATA